MINYYDIPDEKIPMSMRKLRKILQERNWRAEKLILEGDNDLILTRPDGVQIRIASSSPPTTSVFAKKLADNKLMCYELLKTIAVPQPETIAIHAESDLIPLLEKYGKIVIKPIDGAHGNGVTVGISTLEQARPALTTAQAASPNLNLAVAQPQLPPDQLELRIICIGFRFVEAIARIPAYVTGDGKHTIAELITRENATIRTAAYKSDLAYINVEAAMNYLGDTKDTIPPAGKTVRVMASCNLGQGGTTVDYSDKISDQMKNQAEKIARLTQLPVIGIDYYGNQVIEVNAQPALYYPTGNSTADKAAKAYVDYLETLNL